MDGDLGAAARRSTSEPADDGTGSNARERRSSTEGRIVPGSTVTSRGAEPTAPATRSRHRRLSSKLFGIILLCFLLPFVTVDCGGPVTFTGVHAATGIDRPNEYNDHATPDGWALIAFSSAGVGLLLGLLRGRKGALGGALAGFVGIIGLVGFIISVTGEAYGHAVPRIGYLLSLSSSSARSCSTTTCSAGRGRRGSPTSLSSGLRNEFT
jgi:hypothetical protein